jgi:sugar phosphate isomerase/epimerase
MKNANRNSSFALTRRCFIKAGTLALAPLSGCTSGLHFLSGKKVKVGAHIWVYAAEQPQYDVTPILPQIFADLKYAGLDGVELMHDVLRKGETVEQIAELSKKHELPVIGTSFYGDMWDRSQHQAVFDDAKLVIKNLAKLNGTTFGISVGSAPAKKTEQQLDDQVELLRRVMAVAKENGIEPNLHNHTYEVVDDLHDLKGTLARIPDAKLGPDLNWLVRGGVDPAWFIRKYGRQIVFLHLRNQYKNGRWSESLGEGDMDYPVIAKALRDINFNGTAVIELAHESDFKTTRPLRESWKISREYVRDVLGY